MTQDLPSAADTPGIEEWRRLHPLSPVLRGGLGLVILLGVLLASLRDRLVDWFVDSPSFGTGDVEIDPGSEGDLIDLFGFLAERGLAFLVLLAIGVVLLLVVGISWVLWRFATFRITSSAVEARRGVLFRTHRRAPLERIQSVNVQRSLLARAVGLAQVEVVTAGQGGKVDLAYLSFKDAKLVREQIVRAASVKRSENDSSVPASQLVNYAAEHEHEGVVEEPADDLLAARAREFIDNDVDADALPSLVRVPVARLAASIALSWESLSTVVIIVGVVLGSMFGDIVVLVALVPLIIAWVGVVFGQFNKGFNFSLSRGSDSVRSGSGLTSTVTETIPFGRIHAIEARQPLLWRPLKWWRVRITTAGHSVAQAGQNSHQNVVLPVGREIDVLRVFEALLPGIGDEEHEIAALRDGLAGAGAGYRQAERRAGWLLLFGRRRAGALISDGESAEATLRLRRGAITRSFAIMPVLHAQSAQISRSPLHRLFRLASVQAHTVLGPVRMEMRGLDPAGAEQLFGELAQTILRVQNTDAARRASWAAPGDSR